MVVCWGWVRQGCLQPCVAHHDRLRPPPEPLGSCVDDRVEADFVLLAKQARSTCKVAYSGDASIGPRLATSWDYNGANSLNILEVTITFASSEPAMMSKFAIGKAAQTTVDRKRLHIASLVTPLYTWAGAFAASATAS